MICRLVFYLRRPALPYECVDMQLKRVLGPIQLTFYGVAVIVGAGVYSVIGSAAGVAQNGLWLSFVIGAGVALLTAISYAEMTTSFPAAGAEYKYVEKALPDASWAALAIGLILLVGGAATAATVAVAFGGYFRALFGGPVVFSAVALLAACTAINIWGMRESAWVNVLFTAIEVIGLGLVIAAGLTTETFAQPLTTMPDGEIMVAASLLFFVYLGFEQLANLAEEARDPARDLPRALFISLGITTALYVLVALAVVSLASPGELAASGAPLVTAIANAWPQASGVLGATALFATANTVLITMIATSRLAYSMGRDGEIPSLFSRVLPLRGTPWIAALLIFTISAVLVPVGDVKFPRRAVVVLSAAGVPSGECRACDPALSASQP